jgi:2-succinyl-6-hydroxy-2,4-cyclohexadiene-1-carboxylate synthase
MPPALVLLHGFTQTRQSWRRTARALAGRYRALAPDLPGHGQAAHRTASFPAVTAYVRALAPQPFTLVGYSMGGRIALHAAFQLRPERLVLIGASPGIADPVERAARRATDEALAARIEAVGVEAFAAEWGEQPLFAGQPERVRAAANADRLRNTAGGLAAALRGLGTGAMEPLWDRLPELAIPVTLVVGERDEKFRAIAERMRERLPRAHVIVVPGTGHAPQLEAPEATAEAVAYQSGSPSASASA